MLANARYAELPNHVVCCISSNRHLPMPAQISSGNNDFGTSYGVVMPQHRLRLTRHSAQGWRGGATSEVLRLRGRAMAEGCLSASRAIRSNGTGDQPLAMVQPLEVRRLSHTAAQTCARTCARNATLRFPPPPHANERHTA